MNIPDKIPPYDLFMDRFRANNFHGAIAQWRAYCMTDGKCTRLKSVDTPPYLFCANMLHACLLEKSMGGQDVGKEAYHTQALKLKQWILTEERRKW